MFDFKAHRGELLAPVDLNGQNPWNLPDWKDASQYPKGDEVEDGDWRWEFIRRHHDYRKTWLAYQDERCSMRCILRCRKRCVRRRAGIEAPRLGFKYRQLCRMHFRSSCRKRFARTRTQLEASRFRLHMLYSPVCRHDLFYRNPFRNPDNHPVMSSGLWEVAPAFRNGRSTAEFCDRAARNGQYLIAITPTESLDAQWSRIKEAILELNRDWNDGTQPKKRKWNTTNFQRYLRVLDARDETSSQKATWEDIAQVLRGEPGTKAVTKDTVRDYFRQACDVQAKFLITMPP